MATAPHNKYQKQVLGENGFNVLATADATTGTTPVYHAIQSITDATITANCTGASGADTSIDITLLAGQIIAGNFNTVNVTSASSTVIAYLKNE